jgi:hypothetical protein
MGMQPSAQLCLRLADFVLGDWIGTTALLLLECGDGTVWDFGGEEFDGGDGLDGGALPISVNSVAALVYLFGWFLAWRSALMPIPHFHCLGDVILIASF